MEVKLIEYFVDSNFALKDRHCVVGCNELLRNDLDVTKYQELKKAISHNAGDENG